MKSRDVMYSGVMPMGRRLAVFFVISIGSQLGAAAPQPADHAQRMTQGIALFKSTVGPLLRTHCLDCHGGEKVKGDFDLSTRESLLEGGADGVVIEPGNVRDSRMLKQLRHEEEPHMPKKKPALAATEIEAIATWIGLGAPYDRPLVEANGTVPPKGIVSDTHREFWSFRPLAKFTPRPS